MAIGADDAQFCLSEVRIGLAPAVISPFVVQAIGERAARRYALTAERFSGERRPANWACSRKATRLAELDQHIARWIDNLLLNSPQAMRACKDLLREVSHGAPTLAIRRYCENAIARIRVSPEGQEGLRAFLQKRAPSWQIPRAWSRAHDRPSSYHPYWWPNRGEIACRVMRTAKALGLTTSPCTAHRPRRAPLPRSRYLRGPGRQQGGRQLPANRQDHRSGQGQRRPGDTPRLRFFVGERRLCPSD
jgi:hypothetical protein